MSNEINEEKKESVGNPTGDIKLGASSANLATDVLGSLLKVKFIE